MSHLDLGLKFRLLLLERTGAQGRVGVVFAFAKKVAAVALKWYLEHFVSSRRSWCVMVASILANQILCIFCLDVFGLVFGIRLYMTPQDGHRGGGRSGSRFKGGKKTKRDRWFGLKGRPGFDEFEEWWHSEGKQAHGDYDIDSRDMAEEVWQEWEDLTRQS